MIQTELKIIQEISEYIEIRDEKMLFFEKRQLCRFTCGRIAHVKPEWQLPPEENEEDKSAEKGNESIGVQ